jgi:hypothetical protein
VAGQADGASTASAQIDAFIAAQDGWKRDACIRLRALVHEADPEIAEDWKWGSPIFTRRGMVCALGTFKDHVKVNVFKGASLPDPTGLFNAGLEAKISRAIDLAEGQWLDEAAFKALIREAVAANG